MGKTARHSTLKFVAAVNQLIHSVGLRVADGISCMTIDVSMPNDTFLLNIFNDRVARIGATYRPAESA